MPSATTNDGRILSNREAQKDVLGYSRKMNNGRWMPPIIPRVRQLQKEYVHVFSVSPWPHTVAMAEWGSFTIPACPDDQPYVEFLMYDDKGNQTPVPGLMIHYYPQDETRFAVYEEDGHEWADRLLGNDPGVPQAFSLNRFGVFIAKGEKPTPHELAVARDELHQKFQELVQQARDWSTDPIKKDGIRREVHWVAAEKLNMMDEEWMTKRNPQGRQKCGLCGTYSEPGTIKCGNGRCEFIFDHEAYAKVMEQQEAAQARLRKKV